MAEKHFQYKPCVCEICLKGYYWKTLVALRLERC